MEAPTPIRPDEEVVGAFVPITLAGKEYRLAELPRRANREWTRALSEQVRDRLNAVGPLDSADEVIQAIADSAETMMDLLIAYDFAGAKAYNRTSVLPSREFIDTHATDRECYESIKKVTNVAFPFGADLLRIVPELMPTVIDKLSNGVARGVAAAAVTMSLSRSTSSAQPSTDGSPTTSKLA